MRRLMITGVLAVFIAGGAVLAQSRRGPEWPRLESEILQHFQSVVRMDTSDPPGNERPVAEYLVQALKAEGIPVQTFESEPSRVNVVARLSGNGRKRPLLLMAHTDVVTVDPKKWIHPPFSAAREGGYIYGRGTRDDKSHVAAFLMTMLLLKRLAVPLDREQEFIRNRFLSKFARSGAVAAVDLVTRGILESDARTTERLPAVESNECQPTAKLPHIVLIFDESSFDATLMPGIKVGPDYRQHFRSFDGKERKLLVEGAGGPSWFTEYNMLTGLSVRSYGRFAESVTRLAAGHVERGLAHALRHCGYRTHSMYPYYGAFVGARRFHTGAGIERFFDAENLGGFKRTDSHYFDFALRTITWERTGAPMFLFVYTAANHFPWNSRYRPDLQSDWRNLGNRSDVDEYLRRQAMSAQDYPRFLKRLREEFPDESFLLVRFGDHQPLFAKYFVDPTLDEAAVAKRIQAYDPRYLTTYYAIDTVNFTPADLSSALDTLDAPYLPLLLLEAAGVPLDPSFEEQKRILQRCNGLFYACKEGAEASRFNRLLIDAGLINGL